MKISSTSPFLLSSTKEYVRWREAKLSQARTSDNNSVINLKRTPPTFLTVSPNNKLNKNVFNLYPFDEVLSKCNTDNYCLYYIEDYKQYDIPETKRLISLYANDCGLVKRDNNLCSDSDNLTSISRTTHQGQHEYIPYTNKKLNWHTDGYYNPPENTIYSMLLHCYKAADNGGESAFIDHEIAYLLMRDENPAWVDALSQSNVMTIPENILNGKIIRAEQSGPVFSITPQGRLHMRYSARQKNIEWTQNRHTLDAIDFLHDLLNSDSKYIIRHKLKAGEGIISRNILHCRSSFSDNESTHFDSIADSQQRLLFRGRFYDELLSSVT